METEDHLFLAFWVHSQLDLLFPPKQIHQRRSLWQVSVTIPGPIIATIITIVIIIATALEVMGVGRERSYQGFNQDKG